jgi:hypothetical protein
MVLFPLKALGEEGWKIAAALTARHIGGAVNYMVKAGFLFGGFLCAFKAMMASTSLRTLDNRLDRIAVQHF